MHANVLAALTPSVMCYPLSEPMGYAMALGWERAMRENKLGEMSLSLLRTFTRDSCFKKHKNENALVTEL